MALSIHNSLTKKLEPFVPLVPGHVGMYVCGPTVYDHAHLGHARSEVFFDVLARYLAFCGYSLTHVRNYTDIDDRIVARALTEGVSAGVVARRFMDAYREDMEYLNVRGPTREPMVTEHIDDIVAVVKRLMDTGHAYARSGDVYFRVRAVADYGLMAQPGSGGEQPGDRDAVKEDPRDFALWKSIRDGSPAWDSPWGPGRPGWHVECVAMSTKALGCEFDIHAGGRDLVFPHHENERAVSRACAKTNLARYWIHHALVTVAGRKLSRSEGTHLLVRGLAGEFSGKAVRLFILSTHYRRQLDFSLEGLRESSRALGRLAGLVRRWEETFGHLPESLDRDAPLVRRFCAAMDADLNVPEAIHAIFASARGLGRALQEYRRGVSPHPGAAGDMACLVGICTDVLGILP